jgi:anti-sigma factor (TIGR02949 family)
MEAMNRMSCDQAVRQFFAYLDRVLSGEPMEALEAHLEACLDCCDKLQFSRQLDTFVKARLGEDPLPLGLEDRIRRGIARASGATTGRGEA